MSIDIDYIEIACIIGSERSMKRFTNQKDAHNFVSSLETENFAFANVHYWVQETDYTNIVSTKFDILENLVEELS